MFLLEKIEIGSHLVFVIKSQRELPTSLCLRILSMVLPISTQTKQECDSERLFVELEKIEFKNPDVKKQVLTFLEDFME